MAWFDYIDTVISKNKKNVLINMLHDAPSAIIAQVIVLLIEVSLPNIEDPLKDDYTDPDRIPLLTLCYFIDNSPYWWHVREWVRFVHGHHRPIPIVEVNLYANFAKQFPHISREDPKRIAIIMDDAKAQQDIHTAMKIGRYLSKQTDAPESVIPDISNKFVNRNTAYVLEEATTRASIQWVFENGPNSCMGKKMQDRIFITKVHPTHAYASPDIKILFVRSRDNPNRVISRTVASTINNTYSKIYGNKTTMLRLLASTDMTSDQKTGLLNHRICNIEEMHGGKIQHVAPYIDVTLCNIIHTDDPKYLLISNVNVALKENAHLHVGNTHRSYSGKGYIDTAPAQSCAHCDTILEESSTHYYEIENINVCTECASHMRLIYTNTGTTRVSQAYIDEGTHELQDTHTIYWSTSSHRAAYEHNIYIDKEAVSRAGLVPYRKETDMFINVDNAVVINNEYILEQETAYIVYINEKVLKKDCIRINGTYVRKIDMCNGQFKYTTLDGYELTYIAANIYNLYFKIIRKDYDILITNVSEIPKKGYDNLNDIIIYTVLTKHGFTAYDNIPIERIITRPIRMHIMANTPLDTKNVNLIGVTAHVYKQIVPILIENDIKTVRSKYVMTDAQFSDLTRLDIANLTS